MAATVLLRKTFTFIRCAATYSRNYVSARISHLLWRIRLLGSNGKQIQLDHLVRMTDQTGIVEHAVFVVPNYPEGYTTDDNARALIVAMLLEEYGAGAPTGAADLASR